MGKKRPRWLPGKTGCGERHWWEEGAAWSVQFQEVDSVEEGEEGWWDQVPTCCAPG